MTSAITKAIERVAPAVVSIASAPHKVPEDQYVVSPSISLRPGGEHQNESVVEASGGSGFIVSADGIILTNQHVISDEEQFFVTLTDERKFAASILAKDPPGDLAIIKIEAKNLPVAPLGTAKHLELGETVIAIGNAYGQFTNTASAGIVSGLSRSLMAQIDEQHTEELFGLVQTDAAINPGNSGGPLIDLKGEVVGINVAMIVGAQSLSFAVPVDIAIRDLEELKKFGYIRKPYIGIKYLPITDNIQRELGLETNSGALISSQGHKERAVEPGSPAEKAGLQKGDIIIAVNGKDVNQHEPFGAHLTKAEVGTVLVLTILRNKHKKDITVKLEEWRSK